MPTRFIRWEVRTALFALACLFALILYGSTMSTAEPQPAPAAQDGRTSTSMEDRRIILGLPPFQGPQERGVQNRKGSTVDPSAQEAQFKEAKQEADKIIELGQSLKAELDKGNANVVSVSIGEKAKQIEKLAKKIKKWSHAR